MSPPPSDRALPLAGLRVLDVSRLGPGAFCTMLLADFGADVIKVEDTEAGDYARWIGPRIDGVDASAASAVFQSLNRGKRSISVDLKSVPGRDVFLRLVRDADVVLDGFRPGTMARLGLAFAELAELNPRLIYCALTGYGQDGPAAQRVGHDLNYIALAGALELTGELDGPPIIPAIQIADLAGGALMAVVGILLAHAERARSGAGQFVDASMYDGTLSLMVAHTAEYFATAKVTERGTAMLGGGKACYQPYLCKDGWVTFGAIEPKFWAAFCAGVDRPDLVDHHDADTDGWAHGQLELIFLRRTRAEWKAFADTHECCIEPVLRIDEALDSELTRARQMVVQLGGIRALGVPVKLSETPGDPHRLPAPALGEHTAQILIDAGVTEPEIAALRAEGAVR